MRKIIAIDGHAATGKSSQAKKIADFLGYKYIDTGSMYRAVTYYCIISDLLIEPINVKSIVEKLNDINIEFKIINKTQTILLNGYDVEPFIRKMDVAENVSKIAAIAEVRSFLVKIQRQIAINDNVVMDGRDIGTVVFPKAKNKFFLTASPEIRAKRRFEELKSTNETVIYARVLENVKKRDFEDSSRLVSPLKPAKDAIIVETSNLNENEVFDRLISLING